MAMHTVIMAGGQGVRLRPLTQSLPKPLAPLCGEPVMGYTLKLLQRHGIYNATATLWYRPEDVMHAFGAGRHGVNLRYSTEDTPLGTAGSVLKAVGDNRDTTLVLSGDGLTSCDLTRAYAFHRARGAAATLVLTEVDIPLPYGVVVTEEDGRIVRFVEKPDWSRVVGNLVNTGIYFLEPDVLKLIPHDIPYDFGRQLFPRLLQLNLPVYGYVSREYWCDVGDPAAFLRAQGDLLTGRAGFAAVDMGQRTLRDGYISFDSYVSLRAQVAPDAVIRSSCVLQGACVENGVRMKGSILCFGAQAGRGSEMTEGSVLGSGARLEEFSRCEGGRLWSGVKTLPGVVVRSVMKRESSVLCVREGVAYAQEPAQITQLAGALLHAQKAESLAVMHEHDAQAAYALWLGALASYGIQEIAECGHGTQGMLSHAVVQQGLCGGVLVTKNGAVLLDMHGKQLDDAASAQVQAAWQRQETPCVHAQPGAIRRNITQRGAYIKHLAAQFHVDAGLPVQVRLEDDFWRALVQDSLWQAGHAVTEKSNYVLTRCGNHLRLQLDGKVLSSQTEWLLCARALQKEGVLVYDTQGYGTALEGLLPVDDSDACRAQQAMLGDELARMLLLLRLFANEKPQQALQALPEITHRMLEIPCEVRDKSRVLAALLAEAMPSAQGGLEKRERTACAHIKTDPVLPLLRITAYARSAENAQELCDLFDLHIRRAMKNLEKNGSPGMH